MSYTLTRPKSLKENELKEYFISNDMAFIIDEASGPQRKVNEMASDDIYKPELLDLFRLHSFILQNKRTTILEFGCGWSTFVMSKALEKNRELYLEASKKLRVNNPFELHSVDNEKKYLDISENRIIENNVQRTKHHLTTVEIFEFQGKLTTRYNKLPFINPDFIYLDGPDQFNIKGEIRGLSTAHKDFMPMSSDLIMIEHFLNPGTIIIVDGRTANARFLLSNFQRSWSYTHDVEFDQHIFFLDEEPLGIHNKNKLDFYIS